MTRIGYGVIQIARADSDFYRLDLSKNKEKELEKGEK